MKAGWKVKALGEVATIVNGGTPKSGVAEYWGGDVQWLTPKDMGQMDGREIATTPRTITAKGLQGSSAQLVPPFSVILSTRAPIGHLAINTAPMAFNQGCRGIIPSGGLDHLFVFYFLLAHRELLNSLGTGTTFKELSGGSLKAVPIPVPPLEEQQQIVAVLDEAFEGLARARAHAEANLRDARELFDCFLASSFAEGEATWPRKSLNEIAENLDRFRVPITKSERHAGDVPYFGASGVVDHVADFIFDEDLLLVSEDGANLLARTYPIAFSISGKSWVNNHAHVLRFEDPDTQEFARLYLNSISLEPYVSGMAQPKLNQTALNRIPVPYPDRAVRTQIVIKAAELSSATEELACRYRANCKDVDELRQALLHKAFSGELT